MNNNLNNNSNINNGNIYRNMYIYGKSFLNVKANDKDKDKKIESNTKTILYMMIQNNVKK